MRTASILVLAGLASAGCTGRGNGAAAMGGDDGGDDPGGDPGGEPGLDPVEHDFPPIEVQSGEEITSLCLSWTIQNDAPLFVQSVTLHAGPGWHHSNWFYVPEGTFDVVDGAWDCAQGEFDQVTAALAGGVLFAQSTQSTDETQSFGDGAALEVPPGSVVVSQIHLLNTADSAIDTGASMELSPMAEEEVQVRLHPLSFDFHQLAIPPQQRSRFEAECDMEAAFGAPVDLSIYYALPHYHARGQGMDIDLFGGNQDGVEIYRVTAGIGEPLGAALSPPVAMAGARGIRFSCTYENESDRTIGYGNSGDDEMCIFLAFTDSPLSWAGGVVSGEATLRGIEDGVAVFTGDCSVLPLPSP